MDIKIHYARIGKRLRAARHKCGLKQAQVAEKLGIVENTYSNMERGQQHINLSRIIQLCVLYGVRPGSILDDCCDDLINIQVLPEEPLTESKKQLLLLIGKCSDETADTINTVAKALYEKYEQK